MFDPQKFAGPSYALCVSSLHKGICELRIFLVEEGEVAYV